MMARSKPRKSPVTDASVPITSASTKIERRTWRRVAPSVRSVANSRVRCAIVIDSDTPTLPSGLLERAVTHVASREHDVVLGPSEDGGYYLIGLGRLHRALFEDMPWSTPVVLEETLRRVRDLGLTAAQLEPWYDVDTGADLDRLTAELGAGGDEGPRYTRRLLLSLGRTSASGGDL